MSQKATDTFKVNGTTNQDAIFEIIDNTERQGSVPLKAILRQFLGAPNMKTVPAYQMYMILGRLRALNYIINKYNQGVVSPNKSFLLYWRKRVLNQLSAFGFQITAANQSITIVGLLEIIQEIERLYHSEINEAKSLIQGGMITFESLSELYRCDVPIQGKTSLGGTCGVFQVTECFYEEHRALIGMEKSFHFNLDFVVSMGEHFTVVSFTEVLSGWTGVRARSISELTYSPLPSSEIESVLERSKKYIQFGIGSANFLAYTSNSFFIHSPPAGHGSLSSARGTLLGSGGRVMVDAARGSFLGHHASQGVDEPSQAMIQVSGRYRRWKSSQREASSDSLALWETVPEDLMLFCWPALVGFSFSAKTWGHVLVSGLEEIKFSENAFDQLVLAEERKQLIRALVRFGGEENTQDIVGGKRGGSVFLLHGPPGVGKTLTAEAISEVLHRPLYYVTMGELGMTPDEMEKRLGDVLDLCAGWNALTLLDEADVFLEKRSTSDIVRNAMVCVMLRLLEYHPGILFLTTNRVRSFDPAFESRVTIALRYEPLTSDARIQIWKNLINRVTIQVSNDIQFNELGKFPINGRQIKNAVRLAVALAREKESHLTQKILETTLGITTLGRQEMKEDDSWKEEK